MAHLIKEREQASQALDLKTVEEVERKISESDYRSRLVTRMSGILGLTAAMGTMSVTLIKDLSISSDGGISKIFDLAAPSFTVVLATMVAMISMVLAMKLKTLKGDDSENVNDKSNK